MKNIRGRKQLNRVQLVLQGAKVSQSNLPGNNTMEGQESTSKKRQAKEDLKESQSTCSPLTLPGELPERPGENNTNQPSIPSSTKTNPQSSITPPSLVHSDTFIPKPILEVNRPLTSSRLASPPPSLPLIKFPNYPPRELKVSARPILSRTLVGGNSKLRA